MEWTPNGSSVLVQIPSLLTTNLTERKNILWKNISDKENTTGKVTQFILLKHIPNWNFHSIVSKKLTLCPEKCTLITSRENLSVFDAVIFNAVGYPMNRPPKKVPGQVWIFFTLESPYFSFDYNFNSTEWRNKINRTMTYGSYSDIWYPYGRISKKEKSSKIHFTEVTKTKTKLVAWFVSHCGTPSLREKYVHELKRTLPVDVYGACESKRCPRNQGRRCLEMLSRDYKLYLSFESSLCYDYYYLDYQTTHSCELCKRLSNPSEYANLYKNVYTWWHHGMCKAPRDLKVLTQQQKQQIQQ